MQPRSSDLIGAKLRHARDNDLDALAWLIEYFTPVLTASVRRRVSGHPVLKHQAEDLLHEVWYVFMRKISAIDERPGVSPTLTIMRFLSNTLANLYLNLARKRANHSLCVSHDESNPEDSDRLATLPAQTSGVITKVARGEQKDLIEKALLELTETDREIIELRGLDQLSTADVARQLRIPAKTVTTRYRRALERLRQRIPGGIFGGLLEAEFEDDFVEPE